FCDNRLLIGRERSGFGSGLHLKWKKKTKWNDEAPQTARCECHNRRIYLHALKSYRRYHFWCGPAWPQRTSLQPRCAIGMGNNPDGGRGQLPKCMDLGDRNADRVRKKPQSAFLCTCGVGSEVSSFPVLIEAKM